MTLAQKTTMKSAAHTPTFKVSGPSLPSPSQRLLGVRKSSSNLLSCAAEGEASQAGTPLPCPGLKFQKARAGKRPNKKLIVCREGQPQSPHLYNGHRDTLSHQTLQSPRHEHNCERTLPLRRLYWCENHWIFPPSTFPSALALAPQMAQVAPPTSVTGRAGLTLALLPGTWLLAGWASLRWAC